MKLHESIFMASMTAKMLPEQIADQCGEEKETILDWQRGSVEPNHSQLTTLANVLEVDVSYFEERDNG